VFVFVHRRGEGTRSIHLSVHRLASVLLPVSSLAVLPVVPAVGHVGVGSGAPVRRLRRRGGRVPRTWMDERVGSFRV